MNVFYDTISTHTPLARRDLYRLAELADQKRFLLTRLSRGVTVDGIFGRQTKKFLLTRLSRGVTRLFLLLRILLWISTHTPLARRDVIC